MKNLKLAVLVFLSSITASAAASQINMSLDDIKKEHREYRQRQEREAQWEQRIAETCPNSLSVYGSFYLLSCAARHPDALNQNQILLHETPQCRNLLADLVTEYGTSLNIPYQVNNISLRPYKKD